MAQNFLVGIPGIGSPTGDFDGYINAIYAMFISIAALLAVVKIVIAGVKYMFSDIVTQKSEAKKDIQGAIFGLVLILGAVLILTVINPDLTNFNLEQNQIPLPEPVPPAPGELLSNDALNILDYCNGEGVDSCQTQSCAYFDSPDAFGLLGVIAAPADWLLNSVGCRVWCDGLNGRVVNANAISSGSCIYGEEFSQEILVNSVLQETNFCGAAGCSVVSCSFWRLEVSCQDWCDNRGGQNVSTSFLSETAQCIIPKVNLEDGPIILDCVSDSGMTDCRPAISRCEAGGGAATTQLNQSEILEVLCVTSTNVNTVPNTSARTDFADDPSCSEFGTCN